MSFRISIKRYLRYEIKSLVGKREKVEFAQTVDEYSRKFKVEKRDLVLNGKALWLIGREKVKSGPEKGNLVPAVSRKVEFDTINKVSLSPRQDDMVIIEVTGEPATVLDIPLKTEFITQLVKKIKDKTKRNLNLEFTDM